MPGSDEFVAQKIRSPGRRLPYDTGVVEAVWFHEPEAWGFEVRDNGEGIALEDQKRIFDKYAQVAPQEDRARTGAGLGLTFCKLAVEAHGGVIRVESAPGEGTVFRVRLPLVQPAPVAQPDAEPAAAR